MTIADQILAAVAGRETFRRAELFDAIEASENGIDVALKALCDAGKLTRVSPGVYGPADGSQAAAPEPAEPTAPSTPRKPRQKPAAPTAAEAESTTEPEPELELAAWRTGELTVRRGEQVVLLAPAEVETLLLFAGRMLRVED